ncbi:MAG: L,D-transpeptidase [Patescibacteria group bacterium]
MKRLFILLTILFLFPLSARAEEIRPQKRIDIDLSEQRLRYYFGDIEVSSILISSGLPMTPTPVGEFTVLKKLPLVRYRGLNRDGTVAYDYPRTKWNLMFYPRYYIHGSYWHNAFGTPRSHGCINVSYDDMEQIYNFATIGTRVTIHD